MLINAPSSQSMDTPTITVFKSPPWHKPLIKAPPPQPKLSDIYEEYPKHPKFYGKGLLSKSLECIPEHTVLNGGPVTRTNRLSPHQTLPPIQRSDDLTPQTRQRANSDPNRYRRRRDEARESPLVRSHAPLVRSHAPCEVKPRDGARWRHVGPVRCKPPIAIKENQTQGGTAAKQDSRRLAKLRRRTSLNANNEGTKVAAEPYWKPSRAAAPLAQLPGLIHPKVQALRETYRPRAVSNPEYLAEPLTPLNVSIKPTKRGDDSSLAYALVGSPGRDRWPESESSWFLADTSSSRSKELSPPPIGHEPHASLEFKAILDNLRLSGTPSPPLNRE